MVAAGTALRHRQKSRAFPSPACSPASKGTERHSFHHSAPGRLRPCLGFQLIPSHPRAPSHLLRALLWLERVEPAYPKHIRNYALLSQTWISRNPISLRSTSNRRRDPQALSLQRLLNPPSFLSSSYSSALAHAAPGPFPRGFCPHVQLLWDSSEKPCRPPSL